MDIRKRPKAEAIDANTIGQDIKRYSVTTLKEFITDGDSRIDRLLSLKQWAERSPISKWNEYLDFYRKNLSGDMATFKPDLKIYAEKIKKEIDQKRSTEVSE